MSKFFDKDFVLRIQVEFEMKDPEFSKRAVQFEQQPDIVVFCTLKLMTILTLSIVFMEE